MVNSEKITPEKPLVAPRAKKVPTERVFHGHSYVDNYEWLRDKNDPDLNRLLKAENAYAKKFLKPLEPLRNQLVREFKHRTWESDYTLPIRFGNWWYFTRTFKDRQYSAMYRIRVEDGIHPTRKEFVNEALVWDGNSIGDGQDFFACGGFLPSPDGTLGAMIIDLTGDEHYTLRIFDIESGLILDDSVRNVGYGLAWTADSRSVAYTRVDDSWRQSHVMLHTIGHFDDAVLFEEHDERFDLVLSSCRNGNWMIINSVSVTSTETTLVSTNDISRRFVVTPRKENLEYVVEPAGDQLLIVHNANNPDFEVASAPIRSSTMAEWTPVFTPEAGERVSGVDAYAKHAVLSMRSGGNTQLRVMERGEDKTWRTPIVVPQSEGSTVEAYMDGYWNSDSVIFTEESVLLPPTQKAFSVETGQVRTLKSLEVPNYDPHAYVQQRVEVEARDGAKIPLTLVYRADLQPNGENPGYIYGYGSYEISTEPTFNVQRFSYLDRGVVVALAHVRGGGEFGRAWYEGGKLLQKKNTFHDFVDCSRWLISSGWVAENRLAAEGASAGGLLIGAAMNEAPELFCAVHAGVPFVDNLTTILNPELPLTISEWEEWGNPIQSPEVYEYMASYAPIENVQEARYPAILATTSMNDIRVLYVEPTKWVQVLRDRVLADPQRPIIEVIDMASGHAGKSGRYDRWTERAQEMAWLLYHLGVAA